MSRAVEMLSYGLAGQQVPAIRACVGALQCKTRENQYHDIDGMKKSNVLFCVQCIKMAQTKTKKSTVKKSTTGQPKKGDSQKFTVLLGGKRKSRTVTAPIEGFKTYTRNGRSTRIAYAKNPLKKSVGGGDKVYRIVPLKK